MAYDTTLKIRLSEEELNHWRKQAKALGISLSEYVRQAVTAHIVWDRLYLLIHEDNAEVKHVDQ